MKAALDHINREVEGVATYWFKPERHIDFIAGQFIELYLPHQPTDERGDRHWFTVSSSPTDLPLISITTRFNQKLSSSFKHRLRQLGIGEVVDITDPMGDFVLPKDDSIPLLFVAAGLGITPFHSIIRWLTYTKTQRHLSLIYAVNSESNLVFKDEFEAARIKPIFIIKHASKSWKGQVGSLSGQKIIELGHLTLNTLVYLAGPEHLVEKLNAELVALGIPNKQLVVDFFHGYD